ncbi:MAG: metalloprotease PmbA [bacterium]
MSEHDEQQVCDAVEQVLDVARRLGATAADAGASMDSGISLSVRKGEIETLEHHLGQNLSVTVYNGSQKGSASTTDLSPAAIEEAVSAAMSIARHTSEDPCNGLAPAERMAKRLPDLDLYHPWDIDAPGLIELATECEQVALEADPRICNSEGSSVNTFGGVSAYGNSHGFLGARKGSQHSVSCSVIAEDSNGMQRDYWYTSSRLPQELEAADAVGRKAAERTLRRLSARSLSTRECPVIYAAEMSRGLLGHLLGGISGGALYRKASFLMDALDTPIYPDFVRISENPLLPQGMASTPFDNEGVATQARDLVSDGILKGFVLSQYSACKMGLETTGNAGGVHNLSIEPGDKGLPELLKEMDTGLLVTELMGQSINMITGDYSRGAAGFWVENGEIQYPVEEVTVAGNLADMFKGLVAVGNDIDRRGSVRTGSWLIDRMTVAGNG